MIDKDLLKECLTVSIETFEAVKKEKGVIFSSEDVTKAALSLFIAYSRNGNTGHGGNGGSAPSKGNGGDSKGNGGATPGNGNGKDDEATPKQLLFLKKHGGKNIILVGLSKAKASEMIAKIHGMWSPR